MQTTVKKWFKDKGYGFLENGNGPDILVHKNQLVRCHYLRPGAQVEFECHPSDKGLIAKQVKLANNNQSQQPKHNQNKNYGNSTEWRPGAMT